MVAEPRQRDWLCEPCERCRCSVVSARDVLKSEPLRIRMKQVLQGMVELNDRVVQAEERAAEAERQGQAVQQDLARLQQTTSKGSVKGPAPTQQEQGIGAFASKDQPQQFDGEYDGGREFVGVLRRWSGRFFGGPLGDIYECLESHRNDPGTVNDLELALLNYDGGLVRNIATAGNERTSTSTGAKDGRAGGLGPTTFSSGSTSH